MNMEDKHQLTWLITGASSGFGKSLALAALNSGHRVIGTSRDVPNARRSFPEFQGSRATWLHLDPGSPTAYEVVAQLSESNEIDVLVNNAGYAFIGGVEDTSEEEIRAQMEVNFYGPLRLIRALLPSMRLRNSGNIVLISSGAGFQGRPGRGTYAASKWAIEAIHESLHGEVHSFGIDVLIVEPGAFRTAFSNRLITSARHEGNGGFSEPYRGTIVETMVSGAGNISKVPGFIKGDPEKAARAILDAVEQGHNYLRLPLGPDCVKALETKISQLNHDLEATRTVASSTDTD